MNVSPAITSSFVHGADGACIERVTKRTCGDDGLQPLLEKETKKEREEKMGQLSLC